MNEHKILRSVARYTALFLLSILFTQYGLICVNASAAPIPEQVEASIVIHSDDPSSIENHCASQTGCVHPCHFTTMSTPDQQEEAFLPESYQACAESISPLTASHAVFHPPRLS